MTGASSGAGQGGILARMEPEVWSLVVLVGCVVLGLVGGWIPGFDDVFGPPRMTYYSNASRSDRVGPDDLPGSIAVIASADDAMPIGMASSAGHLGGWVGDTYLGPIEAVWRLEVGKEPVEGRFALRRGVFVELAEGAE